MKVLQWFVVLGVCSMWVSGFAFGADESLVVYSGRKEKAIKPVIEAFEKETQISVLLKVGKTGGLLNQLIQEKSHPIADIFIATTAGAVEAARSHDLFEPYESPASLDVPSEYKSSDAIWTGISGRARIILYNKERVNENNLPSSVTELADPKWKNKIAIAGTRERTTLSWLSGLIASLGKDEAKAFVDGLVANKIAILPDNTDVRRGVGTGEFAMGITNSPNYFLNRDEGLSVGRIFPDQGPGQMGVLINPNTVSIVRGTHHLSEAQRFVDFVLSDRAAQILAESSYEIPLKQGLQAGEEKGLSDIRVMQVSQEELGNLAQETMEAFPSF